MEDPTTITPGVGAIIPATIRATTTITIPNMEGTVTAAVATTITTMANHTVVAKRAIATAEEAAAVAEAATVAVADATANRLTD
jgi:hypothetical protein